MNICPKGVIAFLSSTLVRKTNGLEATNCSRVNYISLIKEKKKNLDLFVKSLG